MKLNKKGFTLVELLAVIVILAIIAVIAVPSILGIIDDARRDAFLADIRSAFKAAELKYAKEQMAITPVLPPYQVEDLDLENDNFTAGAIGFTEDGVAYIDEQIVSTKGYNSGVTTGSGVTMGSITAVKQ